MGVKNQGGIYFHLRFSWTSLRKRCRDILPASTAFSWQVELRLAWHYRTATQHVGSLDAVDAAASNENVLGRLYPINAVSQQLAYNNIGSVYAAIIDAAVSLRIDSNLKIHVAGARDCNAQIRGEVRVTMGA